MKEERVSITISIPASLVEAFDKMAEEQDGIRSRLIARALREWLADRRGARHA
jgi:metal-responsive CopG/Arc/MetJ family transcriptional regulator